MPKGIVIEINRDKGYGFIKENENGFFIRFNTSDLSAKLIPQDEVVYSILDLDPGKIAVNIRPANEQQQKAS